MKIEEIRQQLITDFNLSEKELAGKKKTELAEMLAKLQSLNDIEFEDENELSDVVEEDVEIEEDISDEDEVPDISSPKWTQYVMTLFEDSELENNLPKVDGLRRVARLLNGTLAIQSHVVHAPSKNDPTATVQVTIGQYLGDSFYEIVSSCADVSPDNTQKPYSLHPVAMADTRAEGRALRKLLGLQNILSAEELNTNVKSIEDKSCENEKASEDMITGVRAMCSSVNVNVDKLAAMINGDISDLSDLTIGNVREISKKINEFRKNPDDIPAKLRS